MIKLIAYCSFANHNSTETVPSDLAGILLQSRRFNQRHSITGFLSYRSGQYLGVIEGHPEVIDPLYDRLKADTRHRDMQLLIDDSSLQERLFSHWTLETAADSKNQTAVQSFFEVYQTPINALGYKLRQRLEVFAPGSPKPEKVQPKSHARQDAFEFHLDALPLHVQEFDCLPQRMQIMALLMRGWLSIEQLVKLSAMEREFIEQTLEHSLLKSNLKKRPAEALEVDNTTVSDKNTNNITRTRRSKLQAFFARFF